MKTAVIYARVSDEKQVHGTSLDNQIEQCRQEAERLGFEVIEALREEGVSGKVVDRPSVNRLLELANQRVVDVVILSKVDRLARGLVTDTILTSELAKRGVHVHYVGRDTSTTAGRLGINMEKVIAEYERELIIERTSGGRKRRAQEGKVMPPSCPPYGYDYVKGKYIFVINDCEAGIVRLIFHKLVVEGKSLNAIVGWLNENHVPAKKGGRWGRKTLTNILTNRVYIGVYTFDGVEVQGPQVPAIIAPDVFEQVPERLAFNKANSPRKCKRDYLLRSLTRCATCDCTYVGHAALHGRYLYYRASTEKGNHSAYPPRSSGATGADCKHTMYNSEKLERLVWRVVIHQLQVEDTALFVNQSIKAAELEAEMDRAALDRLSFNEDRLATGRAKMLQAYQAGAATLEELQASKANFEKQQADIATDRARIQARLEARQETVDTQQFMVEMQPLLKLLAIKYQRQEPTFEEKRRLLERLQIRVRVDGDEVCVRGLVTDALFSYSTALIEWVGLHGHEEIHDTVTTWLAKLNLDRRYSCETRIDDADPEKVSLYIYPYQEAEPVFAYTSFQARLRHRRCHLRPRS